MRSTRRGPPADADNSRVVLFDTPAPLLTSLKIARSARGVARLVVVGYGMIADDAVVDVNGRALESTRYKDVAADGSAQRFVATDRDFEVLIPCGVTMHEAVFNPTRGRRSAPISLTRR